jgi:myo-inositol-1(or 4)-monophosphatase
MFPEMDLEYVKQVAIGAAYKSARVLKAHLGHLTQIKKKGEIDIVTEADTASEKVILDTLAYRFPGHSVMAEESGRRDGDPDCQWIIDPLDGTTNYSRELGLFAVSIAFAYRGEIVVGVVLNPQTAELFSAVKGAGASLNNRKLRVSETASMRDSLLVTGFPYNLRDGIRPLMARFEACILASRGVRRLGSAALDLCYVACGRFDGFWEQNLKPWDTAAGLVIAREAGAEVTDFSGNPYDVEKKEILATNGRIHRNMIEQLALKGETCG